MDEGLNAKLREFGEALSERSSKRWKCRRGAGITEADKPNTIMSSSDYFGIAVITS